MERLKYSIVIPVYKNEASLELLLGNLNVLRKELAELEVVFVVDGSPDQSFLKLRELLPNVSFDSQLILLSRNFGSFAAISAGPATTDTGATRVEYPRVH